MWQLNNFSNWAELNTPGYYGFPPLNTEYSKGDCFSESSSVFCEGPTPMVSLFQKHPLHIRQLLT